MKNTRRSTLIGRGKIGHLHRRNTAERTKIRSFAEFLDLTLATDEPELRRGFHELRQFLVTNYSRSLRKEAKARSQEKALRARGIRPVAIQQDKA